MISWTGVFCSRLSKISSQLIRVFSNARNPTSLALTFGYNLGRGFEELVAQLIMFPCAPCICIIK
ncbi:hypothetical protein I7I50_07104 [Histoplasma capsulatum G186AR]|uniref:Uncharacterized protein n=1 Tax=Ajellomyces capsulatus TaxID=5037 RepID=A0A8H8D3B7_AJECA|nr:hypothetical protein I7I52_09852 [Histoplasma capsulatum]QSS67894.1 hypothetical protein I7I50_07104 [Histoplasma capsulatum G186AR]